MIQNTNNRSTNCSSDFPQESFLAFKSDAPLPTSNAYFQDESQYEKGFQDGGLVKESYYQQSQEDNCFAKQIYAGEGEENNTHLDINKQKITSLANITEDFTIGENRESRQIEQEVREAHHSPQSKSSINGELQNNSNHIKGEHSSNSSLDKSTSAFSSNMSTPAPQAQKFNSDIEGQVSNQVTSQSIQIRVQPQQQQSALLQQQAPTDQAISDQQNLYGTQQTTTTANLVKRGRKQTAQNQAIGNTFNVNSLSLGKYQKETEQRAKQGSIFRQGRWTKEEHYRFLEALKLHGKEWRKVQMHVRTRTSTQARSHAQKFFVKIEKKNLSLEEFLKDLDLNNLEQDMMFSDLEDDDPSESKMGKSNEGERNGGEESSNLGGANNEESLTKLSKNNRKKSVMSYGLSHLEEIDEDNEDQQQMSNQPSNNQQLSPSKSISKYEASNSSPNHHADKSMETAGGASPTRPVHMRQSKMNHTILQKRYRDEDNNNSFRKESLDQQQQPSQATAVLENQDKIEQGYIVQKQNKRRAINSNTNQRKGVLNSSNSFAEPAQPHHHYSTTDVPPALQHYQSEQIPQKAQPIIPLTPNLKHSHPANIKLYDDSHVFKRSNSQDEFGFLGLGLGGMGGSITQNFLDFNALDTTPNNHNMMDNIFMSKPHDYIQSNPLLDKSYSTPFPFASLAAGTIMNSNVHQANDQQPQGIAQHQEAYNYRPSFDLLEMDSQNLLEMTGDNFQRMYNHGGHHQHPQQRSSANNLDHLNPSNYLYANATSTRQLPHSSTHLVNHQLHYGSNTNNLH